MTELKKIRTRLSPEVRKHLLLDRAADLVAAEGVSAFNMEPHQSAVTREMAR